MYKYKATVVKPIIVHGRVWYGKGTVVDVEAKTQEDTTNAKAEVAIRVSKHVEIDITATDVKEIEGTGYVE